MTPPRDRDETGQFADGIDPETALDVFDARTDAARPLTAGDVADELGIARRTAHNKLTDLVDRGTLETRKVGAKGRVYWTPIPAGDEDGATNGPETAETPPADRRDADAPDDAHDAVTADDDLRDRARSILDAIDDEHGLAGSGREYFRRRDAVIHLYDHLRDNEGDRITKSELLGTLGDGDDETASGYRGGPSSLWSNWVKGSGDKPNLLTALPGAEQLGNGYEFRREYIDDDGGT